MAGNAGLFGGIGPVAAVNQAYAPQQQYLQQQQASRNAALKAIFQAILGALPSQQSVDAPYMAASQDTNNLARASAAGLQAANPDAQTQAGLRAIGAPASQQAQVGNIDNTSFNGNANLLGGLGALSSGVFNQDMQARNTYLASLPAILAGYAKQGVGQLAGIADKENMGLAQDRANSLIKARTDLANFVQQNQSAKSLANYRQATINQKTQAAQAKADAAQAALGRPSASLSRALGYVVDATGNPVLRGGKLAVLPGYQISKNGQIVKTTSSSKSGGGGVTGKYSISSTLSKQTGFWTDTHGTVIIGPDGKPIAWKNTVKGAKPVTVAQAARFNGSLQTGLDSMPQGTTYAQFVEESVKQKVPIGFAIAFANKHWPLTQRATPEQIGQIAGATPQSVVQSGYPQQAAAVQQTTGQIPGLRRLAAKYGLDPVAVMSVAAQEGLGGGVGDGGTSFGPFQLHVGGALPKSVAARGAQYAQQWAWSVAGVDYALRQMSKVARGLTGQQAVDAIVRRFERPANPGRESANAAAYYGRMGA